MKNENNNRIAPMSPPDVSALARPVRLPAQLGMETFVGGWVARIHMHDPYA